MVTFTTKMAKKQKQMPTIEVLEALLKKAKSEKQKKEKCKEKEKENRSKNKTIRKHCSTSKIGYAWCFESKSGLLDGIECC